jgi:hypothetical protein
MNLSRRTAFHRIGSFWNIAVPSECALIVEWEDDY